MLFSLLEDNTLYLGGHQLGKDSVQKNNYCALTRLGSALSVLAKPQGPFCMLFLKGALLQNQAEHLEGSDHATSMLKDDLIC